MNKYKIRLTLNGEEKVVEETKCKDIHEALERQRYRAEQFNWEITEILKDVHHSEN